MMSKKERLFGLDLLKILATFTVLSVHFFLNTQFYNTNATGFSITIQVIIRNLCMICIPLFVMLSGYLNNKKDYNKKFFIELLEIIVIWLFYSIIEFITTSIMNNNLSTFNIKTMLYKISIFTACRYSWYIEMFIGLYMMTPILNRAYDSFDDKSKKIVTFLALLLTIGFSFLNGVFSNIIHFPLYWGNLYFIAYYLAGKNIAYFKPDYKKLNLIILLIINTIACVFYARGGLLEYYSLFIFTEALFLFLIIYNITTQNKYLKKLSCFFANISLDIYLASSLVDIFIYKYLYEFTGNPNQQKVIVYFPIVIILSFTLSTIYAIIRKTIIRLRK